MEVDLVAQDDFIAGRYLPVNGEKVRRGGQATVYKCFDSETSDFVAVKIVEGLFPDETAKKIFQREVGALKKFKHDGIVGYRTSGFDDSGRMFIVLDWVETSLDKVLEERWPLDWSEAVGKFVRPLAKTLSHIHLNLVEHRDIKPSNILIDEFGKPLFADFGVGKSQVSDEHSELTVRGFRSGIWAPPEKTGRAYTRDVYSMAVLFLRLAYPERLEEFHELEPAIQRMLLPAPLKDLLLRSVSIDPEMRPANGAIFHRELEEMIQSGKKKADPSLIVVLGMTNKAVGRIGGQYANRDQVRRIVDRDLSGNTHLEYAWNREAEERNRETLHLLGESIRYILKRNTGRAGFSIIDANRPEDDVRERARGRALRLPPSVSWITRDVRGNDDSLDLINRLDSFYDSADMSHEVDEPAQASMTSTWRRLMAAREELERGGRIPLAFRSWSPRTAGGVFELTAAVDAELIGSEWQVRSTGGGRPLATGEVVEQNATSVTLRWIGRPPRAAPRSGTLDPFLGPSQVAFQRQGDAISALENGTAVSDRLREILDEPHLASAPQPIDTPRWQLDLDDDKRQAIIGALGVPECAVLKGPPGTGKTRFIAELVTQELLRKPDARILIVSQTHIAVDNALARLESAGIKSLVRLGKQDDLRVGEGSRHLLLASQLSQWAAGTRKRAERHLADAAAVAGLSVTDVRALSALTTLLSTMKTVAFLQERLTESTSDDTTLATELGILPDALTLQERLEAARDSEADLLRQARALYGEVTLDEDPEPEDVQAAIALLSERSSSAPHLLRKLELQAEWFERLESDESLSAEFLRATSVIGGTCIGFLGIPSVRDLEIDLCIVDEASKATSTEALVPVVRARRFVLVGDLHQLPPIDEDLIQNRKLLADHDLSRADVEETLFRRLVDHLPSANQFTLTEQRRMIAPIGDMISECFYDGALNSPNSDGLTGYDSLGKPVLWIDTSGLGQRRFEDTEAGVAGKYVNRAEADQIVDRLRTLDAGLRRGFIQTRVGSSLETLVLAPYRSQVDHLRRRLAREKFAHLQLSIETVDAVQGREADITLFSVTRSNNRQSMGFLGPDYWRRINVALSRARFGLTIFGDAPFCATGALGQVANYVRMHPDTCEMRKAHG
ncbi:AAA domain-containing protein [Mycetocola sp. 2940]|uniref:AAA domain-containing protein n=1 Tax=Mycetocola sp. 2940 TaxID=3156452 RepID=UPI003391DA3F